MSKKGPGRADRSGISLLELFELFPDEQAAREWFEDLRWSGGDRYCPRCLSRNTRVRESEHPAPYWCPDCRKYFSVKVGTIMESSNLPLRKWVIALYLFSTNLKGVSSMKLHRDLGVTQKTAWMMGQKIRECWWEEWNLLTGEVEVDETFIGGKASNKHGGSSSDKVPVVGAKQRGGSVVAQPIAHTDKETLQGFVADVVAPGATVYTDGYPAYAGLPSVTHEVVKHSVGEYVKGQAYTNSVESFWSMLKRGYVGTYHWMSPKHLHRYVTEFAGRSNVRDYDTLTQMKLLAYGMLGKQLRYQDLVEE